MTALIAILGQIWPFILGGAGVLWGVFSHLNAKSKVANAQKQATVDVAAAQAQKQVAEDNLNARKTADVQADADAAKTAASAAQERTDVENSQAALDDAAARADLLSMLHGSGSANPGAGQGSAGTDPNRG